MKLSACLFLITFFFMLPSSSVNAQELNFDDETTRINYSLGYQIGGDFKRQSVDIDAKAVVQGIRDALAGSTPQMAPEEMRSTLVKLKNKIVADQKKRQQTESKEIIEQGRVFLEQNGKKKDIISLPSGLQYRIIKKGNGKQPGPTDTVSVHYRGTLIDGKEFDSSYKRNEPASFALNGVIKGWSEGLQLMKEGARWELFIPPELGYNNRGPLANQTLIFDVELLSVGSDG
jgi:FKBP-type peptidyl-prolyl cis-trans isomerase FklB